MWRTKDVNFSGYSVLGQTFSYDFNNRLLSSNFGYYSTAWQNTNSFDVSASYDQNGNISNITRYNNSAIQMDNLIYNYFPGYNRLQYISDTQSSVYSTTDVDNQAERPEISFNTEYLKFISDLNCLIEIDLII